MASAARPMIWPMCVMSLYVGRSFFAETSRDDRAVKTYIDVMLCILERSDGGGLTMMQRMAGGSMLVTNNYRTSSHHPEDCVKMFGDGGGPQTVGLFLGHIQD